LAHRAREGTGLGGPARALQPTGTMSAPLVDKVLRETMIETGMLDLPTFFNAVRDNNIKEVQHRMALVDMQAMGGPNIWDEHGQYPIHIAAAEGHTRMVRMIIEMQGDVNQMTQNEHRTALHYAVINKSHSTIRYLIDVGAKTDIKDVFHRTPRMYAVDEEMMRLVFEVRCCDGLL